MILVQPNERKEFTLKNTKINGFKFNVRMTGSAVNVMPYNYDFDLAKTLFKVVLKRDNQTFILIQDDLKTLAIESNLFSMARRSVYQDKAWTLSVVTQTVAIKGEAVLPFDVDLGGILEIKSTDELICELTLQAGFFGAGVDLNGSFIEIKESKTIGFEKYVPYIRSYVISANERRGSFDLGNNVSRIVLLNYDKFDSTNPVVSAITLSTSKLDESFSFTDLLNSRLTNRPDPGQAIANIGGLDEFDQSFVLIEDTELDNCSVDIQFNSAQVASGQNALVVRSAYVDMKTLVEHSAKVQIAQNEKMAELKQNQDNAKV